MNSYTASTISTAGFALGVALFAYHHIMWVRGGGGAAAAAPAVGKKGRGGGGAPGGGKARDPKALVPLWSGIAFGTLAVACPAGLLGVGAGVLRWGGNGVGGMVMSGATGQNPTTVATGGAPALDSYGAIVVTTVVIVLWLLRKKVSKVIKGKFWAGVWCGTLLGITTGVFAIIGKVVVPGANSLGAQAFGALTQGKFL